jgi:hypothetical protein
MALESAFAVNARSLPQYEVTGVRRLMPGRVVEAGFVKP